MVDEEPGTRCPHGRESQGYSRKQKEFLKKEAEPTKEIKGRRALSDDKGKGAQNPHECTRALVRF